MGFGRILHSSRLPDRKHVCFFLLRLLIKPEQGNTEVTIDKTKQNKTKTKQNETNKQKKKKPDLQIRKKKKNTSTTWIRAFQEISVEPTNLRVHNSWKNETMHSNAMQQ
jgi:hypothetical protein